MKNLDENWMFVINFALAVLCIGALLMRGSSCEQRIIEERQQTFRECVQKHSPAECRVAQP